MSSHMPRMKHFYMPPMKHFCRPCPTCGYGDPDCDTCGGQSTACDCEAAYDAEGDRRYSLAKDEGLL